MSGNGFMVEKGEEKLNSGTGAAEHFIKRETRTRIPIQLKAYPQRSYMENNVGQECHLAHELGHAVQQKLEIVRANAGKSCDILSQPFKNDAAIPVQLFSISYSQGKQNVIKAIDNLETFINIARDDKKLRGMLGDVINGIEEIGSIISLRDIDLKDNNNTYSFKDIDQIRAAVIYIRKSLTDFLNKNPKQVIKNMAENQAYGSTFWKPDQSNTKLLDKVPKAFRTYIAQRIISKFIENNWDLFTKLGSALYYHANMPRPVPEKLQDDIAPTDISLDFDNTKSCVITALLFAEEHITDVARVKAFHDDLVNYFNTYPGQPEEPQSGKERFKSNFVWKNYSDTHVHPSIFEFYGYRTTDILKGTRLQDIYKNATKLQDLRGIILIDKHAIGFRYRLDANKPTLDLHDNSGLSALNSRGNDTVEEIYAKKFSEEESRLFRRK